MDVARQTDESVDVDLERVGPGGIPEVVALLEENGLPTDDVDGPDVLLFRGIHGGRTVGVGGLEPSGDAVLLRSIAVAEDVRERGYGTAICRALERESRRRGGERAYLLTTDASGFFEKLGFERCERDDVPDRVGQSRQFTDLCPSSAVCLWRDLTDGRERSSPGD